MGKQKNKIKNSYLGFTIISTVILSIYTLGVILLLFWAFSSSFKVGLFAFDDNVFGLPKFGSDFFQNYIDVFNKLSVPVETATGVKDVMFFEMFINSLLIAVGCTLATLIANVSVAYICAKYKCRYSSILYTIVIVTLILPVVNSLPSTMVIVRGLHIYDTYLEMIILKFNFLGMYFLIFYATFKGISWDYAEAAFIDGASNLTVFIRIMIPMASATIGTIFLLQFINYWNAYEFNLVFLPSMPTIAYGLYYFQNSMRGDLTVQQKFAASIMLAVPMLIIFICLKDKIIGSVSVGGLKE